MDSLHQDVLQIKKVSFIYFSPTGTTKRVIDYIRSCIHKPMEQYDLTNYKYSNALEQITFGDEDFVIFAFPVYSGRVPEVFNERLKAFRAKNTFSAIVATYGNREYDDALLEMQDRALQTGFRIIAALAAVTEHSVVRQIGIGRPNEEDMEQIKQFGERLSKVMEGAVKISNPTTILLPGKHPYRKYRHVPIYPYSMSQCNGCKMCCHVCPVNAITFDGKCHTDKEICFGCLKCVRICPQNARTIGKIKEIGALAFLKMICGKEKKTEAFYENTCFTSQRI